MILHRFMSEVEYAKLMRGETLHNHTVHRLTGRDSDAVGFCFFEEAPSLAVHWLSGVACTDVCVTFDVPAGFMRAAVAKYRDAARGPHVRAPIGHSPNILRTDYCCTQYSQMVLPIIEATRDYRFEGIVRTVLMATCPAYAIYL